MEQAVDNTALPVWVTDKANVATITVTGAATGKCIDGTMTPSTVKDAFKDAFKADAVVKYGPALSIGRFAWTDHDTTQTDIVAAVKTVIEKPEEPPVVCGSEAACAAAAEAAGLAIGGAGYPMAGNWASKGCYAYTSGKYEGMAFYGTGGDADAMAADVADPKYRVMCTAVDSKPEPELGSKSNLGSTNTEASANK